MSQKPLGPRIIISKCSGKILVAHCMAGLGEACSHVAPLGMQYLQGFSEDRHLLIAQAGIDSIHRLFRILSMPTVTQSAYWVTRMMPHRVAVT